MPRLLLFDIDGTMIDTRGSGGGALLDAVEELYGVSRQSLPPLQLAGATDHGVTRSLFESLQREFSADVAKVYLECYLGHLQRRLHAPDFAGIALPGVGSLLNALTGIDGVHLGLLTGNVRHGATAKLQRFDLHHHFVDGAFGDDAEDRNLLGPIALERMQQATGQRFHPGDDVIVIGDTPKDIACAHAFGARCLAVATGSYTVDELMVYSPWQCVASLEDIGHLSQLLREPVSA